MAFLRKFSNGWYWAGAFFVLLPFYRLLLNPELAILFRDASGGFLPGKRIWLEGMIHEGLVPRWNYSALGGTPFYAALESAPLYPLNFLFLPFAATDLTRALTFFAIVHFGLAFLGWMLCLGGLKLKPREAVLLALPLSVSGFWISCINNPTLMASHAMLPYFLFGWLQYLRSSKKAWLCFAAAALALSVYGGEPQVAYLAIFFAAGLLFSLKKTWKNLAELLALSFGLAAAQILPTAKLTLASARGLSNLSLVELERYSLHPMRLFEFFLPLPFGSLQDFAQFKGFPYGNGLDPIPFIPNIYLGSFVVFLLPWAALFWLHKPRRIKNIRFALPLLALATLLVSLGSYSPLPLNRWMVTLVPLWRMFRFPERLVFLPILALVAMAGWVLPKFLRLLRKGSLGFKRRPWVFFLWLPPILFSLPWVIANKIYLNSVLLMSALLLLYSMLALARSARLIKDSQLLALLLLVSAVDLAAVGSEGIFEQPKFLLGLDFYPKLKKMTEEFALSQQKISEGGARRVASFLSGKPDAATERMLANLGDLSKQVAFNIAWMNHNTAVNFGLENTLGYATLMPSIRRDLWNNPRLNHQKLLSLWGTRYILARDPKQTEVLVENAGAVPYAFFAPSIIYAEDPRDAASKLETLDIAAQVVVEAESLKGIFPRDHDIGIKIRERSGSRFSVELRAARKTNTAFFVWNENYVEEWHASFRGEKLEVLRTNGTSMGVALPELRAGESATLEFVYTDPWIVIGQLLTCFTLLLVCYLVAKDLQASNKTIRIDSGNKIQ